MRVSTFSKQDSYLLEERDPKEPVRIPGVIEAPAGSRCKAGSLVEVSVGSQARGQERHAQRLGCKGWAATVLQTPYLGHLSDVLERVLEHVWYRSVVVVPRTAVSPLLRDETYSSTRESAAIF